MSLSHIQIDHVEHKILAKEYNTRFYEVRRLTPQDTGRSFLYATVGIILHNDLSKYVMEVARRGQTDGFSDECKERMDMELIIEIMGNLDGFGQIMTDENKMMMVMNMMKMSGPDRSSN